MCSSHSIHEHIRKGRKMNFMMWHQEFDYALDIQVIGRITCFNITSQFQNKALNEHFGGYTD